MNYNKIYLELIERARNRVPDGYVERHHVLPRCMSGTDDKENLVALYPEEHFLAHVLLVKMYPEHPGLISAVLMMTKGHHGKRVRRRLYGWLKRRHAEYMRKLNTGDGNSQHGTMWIHRGIENKKIKRGDSIPEGWEVGRKLKNSLKTTTSCVVCGCSTGRIKSLYCDEHRINHLLKVSDEELIEALRITSTIRQALLKVGLAAKGGNYKRAKKLRDGSSIGRAPDF